MADPSSTVSSALIGEIFVERGHITPAQLEEALATQAETGELLGEILVSRYNVPRVELAGVLAEQWASMERGGGVAPNEPMAEAAAHFASESNQGDAAAPAEVDFERRPIGEIFVEQGVVTPGELESALATQAESGQRLGEVLVAQGVITRLELASALADQWSTLQKIRPPEPKPAAPWQEIAVRATPPAEAPLSPTPHRYESSAEVEGLRDAVQALEERLRLVTATSSAATESVPEEALSELGATFERRLEELAQRFDETLAADIALVRTALAEVQTRVESPSSDRIDELEKRLETAVDGLLARIESVTNTGTDEAVDGLRAALAGLEHRTADTPTRDELDALRVAFGAVSEDVRRLSEVPSGITYDELEQHLSRVAAELDGRVEALAATPTDTGGLDEVRAQISALGEQVAALPRTTGEPSDLADRVTGLGSRLDEVAQAIAQASADTESLRGAIEAERESRGAIAGKLDETVERLRAIDELRDRVEALGDTPARLDATVGELDSRLTLIAGTVAGLPTSERLAALEESVAALPAAERLVALEGSLAALPGNDRVSALETAVGELSELRARIDAFVATPSGASGDDVAALVGRFDEVTGRLDALATADRVGELERSVESIRSVESGQIDSLRTSVRELSEGLRELSSRPTGVSAEEVEGALAQLRGRLDELAAIQPSTLRGPDDVTREQLDELVNAERKAREQLADQLSELGVTVAGFTALQTRLDALGESVGTDELARKGIDELRVQLEGIGTRIGESAGHELAELKARVDQLADASVEDDSRSQLQELRAQVEEIGARLGESGLAANELQLLRDRVESLATDYGARLDALGVTQERVNELGLRVEQISGPDHGTLERLAALESLHGRIDELAASATSDQAANEAVAELRSRLDELSGSDHTTLERLAALESLHGRIDELAASATSDQAAHEAIAELRSRLEQLSRPDHGTLERLAALEVLPGRIDELAASTTNDQFARDGVAELRSRLDQLAELAAELGSDETARHDLAELTARLDQLRIDGARAEDVTALEDVVARLEGIIAANRDDVDGRFGEIWGKVTELDEFRGRLDRLDAAQAETVGRGEVDDLKTRLAAFAGQLETVAPSDWVAGIERTAAEAAGALQLRLDALEELATSSNSTEELAEARAALANLDARIQQLGHGLEETQGNVVAIDANIAATLQAAVKDMVSASTVTQLAEQIHERLSAIEASAVPTRAALDELGMRLGATEQRAWALPEELDDRFARMHQDLMARIDTVATSHSDALAAVQARLDKAADVDQGRLVALERASAAASTRLEGVETKLADGEETVAKRVDGLEKRFEKEAKRAEERGKATEKAIRKGLAALAERFTANEQAYVESGQALRRTIERLGAAVIEADTRIAEMPLDAPDSGYVAFVPTGDGYRLRPFEGTVPAVGEVIDLGEEGGQLRVSRLATSPLPLDRRACAYLERV